MAGDPWRVSPSPRSRTSDLQEPPRSVVCRRSAPSWRGGGGDQPRTPAAPPSPPSPGRLASSRGVGMAALPEVLHHQGPAGVGPGLGEETTEPQCHVAPGAPASCLPAPRLPTCELTPQPHAGGHLYAPRPAPGSGSELLSGTLTRWPPQAPEPRCSGCWFRSGRSSVGLVRCLCGRCGLAAGWRPGTLSRAGRAGPGRAGPAPASLLGHRQRQDPGRTAQPWKSECQEEKWLKMPKPPAD